MDNKYRHTRTTVSFINYHFVFCPRYRRKIFDIPGLESRFRELILSECEKIDISVLAMECHHDHVHLFLSAPPSLSPADIVHKLKGCTGVAIRQEFEKLSRMPYLWTRNYFVSTAGNVSSKTIQQYVDSQKTRDG